MVVVIVYTELVHLMFEDMKEKHVAFQMFLVCNIQHFTLHYLC